MVYLFPISRTTNVVDAVVLILGSWHFNVKKLIDPTELLFVILKTSWTPDLWKPVILEVKCLLKLTPTWTPFTIAQRGWLVEHIGASPEVVACFLCGSSHKREYLAWSFIYYRQDFHPVALPLHPYQFQLLWRQKKCCHVPSTVSVTHLVGFVI